MTPQIWDIEGLCERLGGDERLAHELARLFVEDARPRLASLQDALEAGDAVVLKREAHSLKGAAATVGADAVAAVSSALQAVGESGRLGSAAEHVSRMAVELERFAAVTGAG